MENNNKIFVVGSGAWGTAIANIISANGFDVSLWARSKKTKTKIKPEKKISRTTDIKSLDGADAIFLAVPTQAIRETLKKFPEIKKRVPLIILSKGIERGTLKLMSEVVEEFFPENPVATLSGPNFAGEIAKRKPAASVLASKNKTAAEELIKILSRENFRVYYSDDVIGAEIGGAVKNVIAIAAGISEGKKLGENARAAIITRGLAEIARLSLALGGKGETLMGLSGVGDLFLTASSKKSRNMKFGFELGRGAALNKLIKENKTIEGLFSSEAVMALSKKHSIEMPICQAVYNILYERRNVDEEIKKLLSRPVKEEF